MKHLYVTLDYSRFEVIPTGVIRTKLIRVKLLNLLSYHNQYGYFNIHIFLSYMSVCLWMCTSVRASQYITTFVTFHVGFYDWFISIIIRYLSCPHHVNKFSNVCTAYVIWYDWFCALKKSFIIELVYVSLMSTPCKWTPKCFNCKQVNIYAFLYHMKKNVSVINTEFAISIMSTPTEFFPFSVRNHFY